MWQVWDVKEGEAKKQHAVDFPGHRMGIRAVALSSDASLLLSAAETSVKLWNPKNGATIRHVDCNHGLCAMFAPGTAFKQPSYPITSGLHAKNCCAAVQSHMYLCKACQFAFCSSMIIK